MLTETDRRVLAELAAGRTQQQVARLLGVEDGTVAMRLMRLRRRRGCETTTQLVVQAVQRGEVA